MNRLRRRSRLIEDDVNPMEGVVNIVDAMLVFACGLILSLVIYWNVDLNSNEMVPVTQGAEAMDPSSLQDQVGKGSEGNFEEVGKVYRDPVTGNLYLAETGGSPSESETGDAPTETGTGNASGEGSTGDAPTEAGAGNASGGGSSGDAQNESANDSTEGNN